jgi:hypothetical protein
MLPEPTIAKPTAGAAVSRPWVMTPLFCVPDTADGGTAPSHPPGFRSTGPARRGSRRSNSRPPQNRSNPGRSNPSRANQSRVNQGPANQSRATPGRATAKTPVRKETTELLAVTAEWLRRALCRSFLRYNIAGDLESAVHAAMNVIEPVLQARDTEITRLRELISIKPPSR